MHTRSLQKLSYGMYVVTAVRNDKLYGCVINTAVQITSSPEQVAISVNHDNATHDAILQSGTFAISILPTDCDPALIGGFGYRSSRDADKFEGVSYHLENDMPVLDAAMGWCTCQIEQSMDAGSHTIFLGKVLQGAVTREDAIPMTYQFYRSVIKGKSPKNAPTYVPPEENT